MMVDGTNKVKIPFSTLEITGATASNTPTCTPKKETNTSTVPLVRNEDTSLLVMFSSPTTIPSKNTIHTNVPWYASAKLNPSPNTTARMSPIRNDQLPNNCFRDPPFAIHIHLFFLVL